MEYEITPTIFTASASLRIDFTLRTIARCFHRVAGKSVLRFIFAICIGNAYVVNSIGAESTDDDFSVNKIFSDGAVIQQGKPVNIWGRARPGASIGVSYDDVSGSAISNDNGEWLVTLPPLTANDGADMVASINGEERFRANNIAAGEVWLCSGQSNMKWPLRLALNANTELANANPPKVRLLSIEHKSSPVPLREIELDTAWEPASTETAKDFSAACYFFGRELQRKTGLTVGLIDSSSGGSVARAWTSNEGLVSTGRFEEILALNELYTRDEKAAEDKWARYIEDWWVRNDVGSQKPQWFNPSIRTDNWREIQLPGFWEDSGIEELAEFNGIVWFRKTIELPQEIAAKDITLNLGIISDWDTVWVNGVEVANTRSNKESRSYTIASSILKSGQNLIAIRVSDSHGNGGFDAKSEAFNLVSSNSTEISLVGTWSYSTSALMEDIVVDFPETPWEGYLGYSTLYNAMLSPILPYSIRGVAWYQGESDRRWPSRYQTMLETLIGDWRSAFRDKELPFIIVQLASYGALKEKPERTIFAEIREAQRLTVLDDDNSALVVTIDLGEPVDVHPANKQEVGQRLYLAADNLIYTPETRERSCGALPIAASLEGNDIKIDFSSACTVSLREYHRPLGFQLCDDLNRCEFAEATLSDDNVIRIHRNSRKDATTVRYCWGGSPTCNLFDPQKVPLSPFEAPIDK